MLGGASSGCGGRPNVKYVKLLHTSHDEVECDGNMKKNDEGLVSSKEQRADEDSHYWLVL